MLAHAVLHGAFALSGSRATVRSRTGLRMSGKPRRVLAELPFAQARAMARSMGMSSREEWDEYSCPGAYRLPNDPDVVWAADWQGWDDWLAQHVEGAYPWCRSLWLWASPQRCAGVVLGLMQGGSFRHQAGRHASLRRGASAGACSWAGQPRGVHAVPGLWCRAGAGGPGGVERRPRASIAREGRCLGRGYGEAPSAA